VILAVDQRTTGTTCLVVDAGLEVRGRGAPVVWRDRRTAERCRSLPAELIRERTGLVPDPYFSATKLEWLLERAELPECELAFGTVDAWLVWKLTGGRVHAARAQGQAGAAARA
jgi:glycerol kinase